MYSNIWLLWRFVGLKFEFSCLWFSGMQWAKNPIGIVSLLFLKISYIKAFTAISFSYFLSPLYMNEAGVQARPCPVWIWRSFLVVKLSILGWRSLLDVICQQASFQEEPSDSEGGMLWTHHGTEEATALVEGRFECVHLGTEVNCLAEVKPLGYWVICWPFFTWFVGNL